MREAPAITIVHHLLEAGCTVKAYDPVAIEEGKRIFGSSIEFSSDMYEAAIDADALLLLTEWNEFRMPNYNILKKLMEEPVIFDGRNIYDPDEMNDYGFSYYCIGRKALNQLVLV